MKVDTKRKNKVNLQTLGINVPRALTFLVVQSWLDGGTEECLAGRALQHVTVHINPAILGTPERGENSGFASPFQTVFLLRKSFSP